jgi:hypothetical protein
MKSSALLVAMVLVFPLEPTQAVCKRPNPRVCTQFFHTDAVFTGKVISVRDWPTAEKNPDGWMYQMEVIKPYRGTSNKTLTLFTENDSGRYRLEEGHSYLIFAHKYEGRLTIDNCGNSSEVANARDAIKQIEEIMARIESASTGDLRGRVTMTSSDEVGVSGVLVSARSGGKRYTGVTDRDGWFHIQMPPGTYTVWPETSEWVVTVHDLTYDDPDHVRVPRGGCAELAFLASHK